MVKGCIGIFYGIYVFGLVICVIICIGIYFGIVFFDLFNNCVVIGVV